MMSDLSAAQVIALTATRIGPVSGRAVYRLSRPTVTEAFSTPFDHLVLSFGREGDTCVFPADDSGRILDFVGFGFGMGPQRWLVGAELDQYVAACIAQHESDGGTGMAVAGDWAVVS